MDFTSEHTDLVVLYNAIKPTRLPWQGMSQKYEYEYVSKISGNRLEQSLIDFVPIIKWTPFSVFSSSICRYLFVFNCTV